MKKVLILILIGMLLFPVGITVCFAESTPKVNVTADKLVNLYDKSQAFHGYVTNANVEKPYDAHYTSQYIAVKEGDLVVFGPALTSQGFHLHGFDDAHAISDSTVQKERLIQIDGRQSESFRYYHLCRRFGGVIATG